MESSRLVITPGASGSAALPATGTPKSPLVESFLKPLMAVLFCLLFGGAFVFAGNQTLDIRAEKDNTGTATFDYESGYFLGLLHFAHHIDNVQRAEMSRHTTRRKGRKRTTTRVVLVHSGGTVPLLEVSSNLNAGEKRATLEAINGFIRDPTRSSFEGSFTFRNAFLWVGLPFLLIGILGLAGLPFSLIKTLRTPHNPTPPPIVR